MITDERVEILKYIIKNKKIDINLIKTLLNVKDLKNITKEQAYALDVLLGNIA